MPPHQGCSAEDRGDLLHPLPTREELVDQLLRWKIKITQYNNPKWDEEKVLQNVYESWPFHMTYNPKYMAKQMKSILNTMATNGADRTNKELLACFGPDADDECEEIIAMLEDGDSEEYGNYWDPPHLGKCCGINGRERREANKFVFCIVQQKTLRNGSLMKSAHRILNAVWSHLMRNQRRQEVMGISRKERLKDPN